MAVALSVAAERCVAHPLAYDQVNISFHSSIGQPKHILTYYYISRSNILNSACVTTSNVETILQKLMILVSRSRGVRNHMILDVPKKYFNI